MAKKLESKLQREIRKAIEKEFGGKWIKIHGGLFQSKGEPDLLGCLMGLYFGLEVKRPDNGKTSEIQRTRMRQIRKAGGCGVVVRSSEEAIQKIYKHLRKYYGEAIKKHFRALSKERSKVRLQRKESGLIHATWDWEDDYFSSSSSKSSPKRQYRKTLNRLS